MSGEAYAVLVRSDTLDNFGEIGPSVQRNIARAVNTTAARARVAAAREIRAQVAFPAQYLSPSAGRLALTKKATASDPSAIIRGRHRPTSLARFARNAMSAGQTGARIEVQPGLSKFLPRAFFVPLRSGADGSSNNLGLAIRLREGQRPNRAYKPKLIGRNLWLLYGPSIDQVLDDVANEIAPDAGEFLAQEFLRLTDLDLQ